MSYGVKYRNTYVDILNVSHQLDILERDFTGSVTTVQATSNPVIFAWDPDSDTKYPTMIVSSIDINWRSPSRQYFRSLFTADKFKYQVKHYTATVLDWQGYLLPDLYSETYDNKDFAVNLKASDGLGLLQNIDFAYGDGSPVTGKISDLAIIKVILEKIYHGLNIACAVDIYETTMDSTDADDPLKQAYTQTEIFEDMNCADILREILKSYGACIFQEKGIWNIVRFCQLTGPYKRRIFDADGIYVSNGTYDPSVILTDENADVATRNVMTMGSTSMKIIPAIKKLRINHDFKYKNNIIPGGSMLPHEFTKTWVGSGRSGSYQYVNNFWQTKQPPDYLTGPDVVGVIVDAENQTYALKLDDIIDAPFLDHRDYKYIETSFVAEADTKKLNFAIDFMATAFTSRDSVLASLLVDIYVQIKCGTHYLTRDGWKDSEDYIRIENHTTNSGWTNVIFEADGLPEDATVYVRIDQMWYEYAGSNVFYGSLYVKNISLQFPDVDYNLEFDTIINNNNNIIPADIDIMTADIPDVVNNKLIYQGGKYLSDGTPTVMWQEKDGDIQEPLLVSLARNITNQYASPSLSYDALIQHAHMSIGSVIADTFDDKYYRVLQISSYSVADCAINATLCEILDLIWAGIALTNDGGSEIGNDAGSLITNDALELITS